MTTLYVDRQDMELRTSSGVLGFHEPSGAHGSIPLAQLDRVILRGRVALSASTLGAMVDAGAAVLILSGRHGRYLATCIGKPHNDVRRRLGQFDAYRDEPARIEWARSLVGAKLDGQSRMLAKALDKRPDRRRPLTRGIRRLTHAKQSLATETLTVPSALGIEGAAAAAYFEAYVTLFASSLGFAGRRRRPPTDPVNSCLSLGYTLLHFEAVAVAHEVGLDPLLGLYHEPSFGRESLASDVIEPLRPHIDAWVWSLFRERRLTASHFRNDKGAVLLGKAGRRRFHESFTPLSEALRRLLRRTLHQVAKDFASRAQISRSNMNSYNETVIA